MAGRNISYVKPTEPSFIKRMKEQVGFKEGPNVDTKREQLPRDDADDDDDDGCVNKNKNKDDDDEKPQVVVLGPGDLTREEVDEIFDRLEPSPSNDHDPVIDAPAVGAKISFRKPDKRLSATEDGGDRDDDQDVQPFGLNSSSKRRRKDSDSCGGGGRKSSEMQRVNNRSLLSFDDGEHDDD